MKTCYSLLLILFFILSGSVQVKTSPDKQPKLVKTQGTGPGANVHCGLQDKAGNLWFGTTGEGIYRYDGRSFTNFTEKDGVGNNNIWSVLEDNRGNIWFGTDAGICRYDGKKFTTIPMAEIKGKNFFSDNSVNKPSQSDAVWCVFQDKKGKLWLGTHQDGIFCYDGKSFSHFLHNDGIENIHGLSLNAVNSIIEDKNGNMWFATWFEGICRYDGKAITSFKPNGELWFVSILEDKEGKIWAGRRTKGVCRYDGKSFSNILQGGIFDSCCVRPLAEDKNGNIWFGSEAADHTKRESTGGLWRYDGESFTNYTTKDGLPNNAVFSGFIDTPGKLWVGTRGMGLSRYDGKTFTSFSD